RDWSSDVCSSDLPELKNDMNKLLFMQKEITSKVRDVIWFIKNEDDALEGLINYCKNYGENLFSNYPVTTTFSVPENFPYIKIFENDRKHFFLRSEERRVGKEYRIWWS